MSFYGYSYLERIAGALEGIRDELAAIREAVTPPTVELGKPTAAPAGWGDIRRD